MNAKNIEKILSSVGIEADAEKVNFPILMGTIRLMQ